MSLLKTVALHRPELRAWAMYDWANSAFMTTIVAAVFPVYFSEVAARDLDPARATQIYAAANAVALLLMACLAPGLGARADAAGCRKKMLAGFMGLAVLSTGALALSGRWEQALALFVLANLGASGSFVFYDSLLPHIAGSDEIDRVSSAGYALGYLGGGLLLALNLAWIQAPQAFGMETAEEAMRLSFLSVALWWSVFALPLFRRVPEPAPGSASRGLRQTLGELRRYPQAFWLLAAFLVYNDGIGTIIRLATAYGSELGLPRESLIGAILMVQFLGFPFTFLFGFLASRVGPRNSILAALAVYVGVTVMAYFMQEALHFYALAAAVAVVQGGSQALSRSLFASLVPVDRSAQFFAFFGVCEKFSGVIGPALFATLAATTGSSRNGILSIGLFFILGMALLARVDLERGRQAAG